MQTGSSSFQSCLDTHSRVWQIRSLKSTLATAAMFFRFSTLVLLAATAIAKVHVVTVGKTPLKFEPQLLRVGRGDKVIFELFPKHNVVKVS